ncbi:MAG TPA: hypothetical protein VIO64_11655 [Pseudobacteroides sp.]|uniref:hypothetical protein n=1 Tax=Pseudobacteroides sp. TaxID=1968840 RepID=UPI002F950375
MAVNSEKLRTWHQGPGMVDYLKSRWTFSWKNADIEESGLLIEFSYELTDIFRDPKSKQVYLSINGQRPHFLI